jgi:hypothetical protein
MGPGKIAQAGTLMSLYKNAMRSICMHLKNSGPGMLTVGNGLRSAIIKACHDSTASSFGQCTPAVLANPTANFMRNAYFVKESLADFMGETHLPGHPTPTLAAR